MYLQILQFFWTIYWFRNGKGLVKRLFDVPTSQIGAYFGAALAVSDLNGDGYVIT